MIVRLIVLAVVLILSSCSIKKTQTCALDFQKTIDYQKKLPTYYKSTGNVYIAGIPVLFKGEFKKGQSTLSLYTIFGQKIGYIKENNKDVCISFNNLKKCGDKDLYKNILNVDIPEKLKDILIGKIDISDANNYSCKDGYLIVRKDDVLYKFKNGKLSEIKYKNYKILYKYKNQKVFIELYDNEDKKAKIVLNKIQRIK